MIGNDKDLSKLAGLLSPTAVEFEALAEASWQALPELFRRSVGRIVIRIEEWPGVACASP